MNLEDFIGENPDIDIVAPAPLPIQTRRLCAPERDEVFSDYSSFFESQIENPPNYSGNSYFYQMHARPIMGLSHHYRLFYHFFSGNVVERESGRRGLRLMWSAPHQIKRTEARPFFTTVEGNIIRNATDLEKIMQNLADGKELTEDEIKKLSKTLDPSKKVIMQLQKEKAPSTYVEKLISHVETLSLIPFGLTSAFPALNRPQNDQNIPSGGEYRAEL